MRKKHIKNLGSGRFGPVYEGVTGQRAVQLLLRRKEGEIINAFNNIYIGPVDLIYGRGGVSGYGLAHILEKHPRVTKHIGKMITRGEVYRLRSDRVYLKVKDKKLSHIVSIIRLDFDKNKKTWLLTSFET